ncbi:MAG: hypothetical protein VXW14_04335 [Candidatus Thermoplasmatota archaeon]|nr:hypothetical protein [Candidatus Thermoplasmatota archaeon]
MSSISPQDLQRLASLQGYDLTLEIDALSRKYGMAADQIMAILRSAQQPAPAANQPFEPVASKTIPQLPSQPRHISMEGLHFDYDPTAGAKSKRAQVDQAIMCPGCGVALGIPSRRPIKVKCPQCMHEALFN